MNCITEYNYQEFIIAQLYNNFFFAVIGSGELNYGSSGDGGSDNIQSLFDSYRVTVIAVAGSLLLAIIIIFTLSSIVIL